MCRDPIGSGLYWMIALTRASYTVAAFRLWMGAKAKKFSDVVRNHIRDSFPNDSFVASYAADASKECGVIVLR